VVKQEARGKLKQLQGRGKELVGTLTGDSEMELEGDRQQAKGEIDESSGKARRKVGELMDETAKRIRG
jgi:uncharacterized protein YjbJ (UPF0337 family)